MKKKGLFSMETRRERERKNEGEGEVSNPLKSVRALLFSVPLNCFKLI